MTGEGDSHAVFVKGLPRSANASQLEEYFSSVGPIKRCFVVTEPGDKSKCSGAGFVHFALQEDAKRALEYFQGATFGGRKIKLDFAKRRQRKPQDPESAEADSRVDEDGGLLRKRPREKISGKPGVTGKAMNSPKALVRGALSGSLGMRTVVVKVRKSGERLDKDDVLEVIGARDEKNGFDSIIMGASGVEARCVFRSWPQAGKAAARIHGEKYDAVLDALQGGKRCRVIVRNLPFDMNIAELRKAFESIAPIRDISLPLKDGSQRPDVGSESIRISKCKGFAFIEYFLAADANQAISTLNGTKVGGRVVAVDMAVGKAAFTARETSRDEFCGQGGSAVEERRPENNPAISSSFSELEKTFDTKDKGTDRIDPAGVASGLAISSSEKENGQARSSEVHGKRPESSEEELKRTVFIRNLLYETSSAELWRAMEEEFGKVEQSVIVKDPLTGRPRGTAFVRFATADQADNAAATSAVDSKCCSSRGAAQASSSFVLQGRPLLIAKATIRERARELVMDSSKKKEKSDTRNIRLAWVGHVDPDALEARGMSEADFAKRTKAEKDKKMKLAQNPNAFVSETRLSVRNLPRFVDEKILKHICLVAARNTRTKDDSTPPVKSVNPCVTHVKVLRDPERGDRSKGYGFVQFKEHRHALQALHRLNNNPSALELLINARPNALSLDDERILYFRENWGKGRRLIVEFSVEDKRKVRIIEKLKQRGKELKDGHSTESGKRKRKFGEVENIPTEETQSASKHQVLKKKKSSDLVNIMQKRSDSGHGKDSTANSSAPQSTRNVRLRRKSEKTPHSLDENRNNKPDRDEENQIKPSRQKRKQKNMEDDSKFENMVALYKKKLSKTGGQKLYEDMPP